MFKRFRISALILAAGTVLTAMPAVSQARDHNDYRGRPVEVSQFTNRNDYRGRPEVSQFTNRNDYRGRPVERHELVSPERARYGFDRYAAPRGYSAPRGYWNSNGVWCTYGR